jgi:hypothetical protein
MKRYSWFVAPALIAVYCCNSEKRVLKNPEKTQRVVTKWLKDQPFKTDTTYITKPGDTVTQLLIGYDTTVVRDTINKVVERTVTKTKTITNYIHDTTTITVFDKKLLNACQQTLKGVDNDLQAKKIEADRQKVIIAGWRLKFFGLLAALVVAGSIYLLIRFKVL